MSNGDTWQFAARPLNWRGFSGGTTPGIRPHRWICSRSDDDDLIAYHARFDEDDFESAYRELEKRYYTGEGAPFAENGRTVCAWMDAIARRDVEAARRVSWPDFRWLASAIVAQTRRAYGRSVLRLAGRAGAATVIHAGLAGDHAVAVAELLRHAQRDSRRGSRGRRVSLGVDPTSVSAATGEHVSMREFDVEDEDAAFAYAESLVAPKSRRLVVSNAASRVADQIVAAMRANDIGAVTDQFLRRHHHTRTGAHSPAL